MNRRLLFLSLVLVILCMCCVSSGLLGRRPLIFAKVDLQGSSLQKVRERLTIKLKAEDVVLKSGAGCAVQGETLRVSQGAVCDFSIRASKRFTRQLVLVLEPPATVASLKLVQPKAVSVDQRLTPGAEPYALDIYSNEDETEAWLTIRNCLFLYPDDSSVCVFEIKH